jgi:RNA polymerase sigma-70 factor, ECF subfamily
MMTTDQIWADLHAKVRAFVRRRVRNDADAEDIAQRCLLHAHDAAATLDEPTRLYAWTFRTARNAVIDYYRSKARSLNRRATTSVDELSEILATPVSDDAHDALLELAGCVRPLITELPEADRDALRTIDLDGGSQVDIARALGLSTSGMKSRIQRARKRLRDAVETCCRVEKDHRGAIVAYQNRESGACRRCGDACQCATRRLPDGRLLTGEPSCGEIA